MPRRAQKGMSEHICERCPALKSDTTVVQVGFLQKVFGRCRHADGLAFHQEFDRLEEGLIIEHGVGMNMDDIAVKFK